LGLNAEGRGGVRRGALSFFIKGRDGEEGEEGVEKLFK